MAKKKEIKGFVETAIVSPISQKDEKKFSELVIKEIMVQKKVNREDAIKILEKYR